MCCENSICSLKVSIIVIIYPYVSFVFASGCKLYGFILNIAYIVRLYPLGMCWLHTSDSWLVSFTFFFVLLSAFTQTMGLGMMWLNKGPAINRSIYFYQLEWCPWHVLQTVNHVHFSSRIAYKNCMYIKLKFWLTFGSQIIWIFFSTSKKMQKNLNLMIWGNDKKIPSLTCSV